MNTKDDIEMKDALAEINKITAKIEGVNLTPPTSAIYAEYKKTLVSLEKSLAIKDSKSMLQNFRYVNRFRKGLNDDDISFIVDVYLRGKYHFSRIPSCETKIKVNNFFILKKSLYEKFGISQNSRLENLVKEAPEFYLFNSLIVLTTLVDKKLYNPSLDILNFLLDYLRQHEASTCHYLKSRIYFYYSLILEKTGKLASQIDTFLTAYRKSCLDLDELTQNTLINCIVRYYLEKNAYEQARMFLSKTKFHENLLTNEDARYLYYLGKFFFF